jgi:sec-independent protein translocase protein TatA
MMDGMVGPQDLLLGLVLAVFFFGAKKLPEIANSLGRGIKEFQKGLTGAPDSPPESNTASATPLAAPTCTACQTPLQSGWSHCPHCGAATGDAPRQTHT